MKSTNQLTGFLAMIFLIALFFLIAGISKLAAQDCKDPLGYSFSYDRERGKAYLLYNLNTDYTFSMNSQNKMALDSVNVYWESKCTVDLSPVEIEKIISRVYHCSLGNALFVYTKKEVLTSQLSWPKTYLVTYNINGKRIGDKIYLLEETESKYSKIGTIVTMGMEIFIFIISIIVLLTCKIRYMIKWIKVPSDPFPYLIPFIVVITWVYFSVANYKDYTGACVYGITYVLFLFANFLIKRIYNKKLAEYKNWFINVSNK